jgi:peroxiredoxin Q/BCP
VILGISFDPVKKNKAFARKYDFPFQLLSDPDRRIGFEYHAAEDPEQAEADRITYLIDPEGTIARVYEKLDASLHPDEVLSDLESLGTEEAPTETEQGS